MFLITPDETQLEFIKKDDAWQPKEKLDEDVTRLIEWLSKQPHLPSITDRTWLSHFIPGCKYNLERSKQVIETYFVKRAEFPEFFEPITKEELTVIKEFGFVYIFPKMTPEGNRITCITSRPFDENRYFDAVLFSKFSVAFLDVHLKEEPLHGNIFLYDLKYFTLSAFMSFTPTLTKRLLTVWLNAFPLRVKSVHFLNPPKFIDRLLTFIKMFIPSKLKDRLVVHDSLDSLHRYFPKDVLPDAYGGTNGNFEKYEENMLQLFETNKEWLATRPKADLSRQPDRPANTGELDMNGTFRQLQID